MEKLEYVRNDHHDAEEYEIKIISHHLPWKHEGQGLCFVPETAKAASQG